MEMKSVENWNVYVAFVKWDFPWNFSRLVEDDIVRKEKIDLPIV